MMRYMKCYGKFNSPKDVDEASVRFLATASAICSLYIVSLSPKTIMSNNYTYVVGHSPFGAIYSFLLIVHSIDQNSVNMHYFFSHCGITIVLKRLENRLDRLICICRHTGRSDGTEQSSLKT